MSNDEHLMGYNYKKGYVKHSENSERYMEYEDFEPVTIKINTDVNWYLSSCTKCYGYYLKNTIYHRHGNVDYTRHIRLPECIELEKCHCASMNLISPSSDVETRKTFRFTDKKYLPDIYVKDYKLTKEINKPKSVTVLQPPNELATKIARCFCEKYNVDPRICKSVITSSFPI